MMRKIALLALLLPALVLAGAEGFEELLFEDFDVVFSAARMEQPIAESPAAITVITAEQIEKSGVRSIPEALRQVPGLSVIQVTAGEYQISSRGFDKIPGNKMAYLVDGMPMVTYGAYDAPVWDLLPITVDDIARIEVIRGPGSSLYGSNAMLGVINIITKDPARSAGGMVSATVGELGTYGGSARYGGVSERYSYRIGADYLMAEEFGKFWDYDDGKLASEDAIDKAAANLRFDYYLNDDSTLSLFAAYARGDGAVAYESTGYMNVEGFDKVDVSLGYSFPNTEITAYMKHINLDGVELRGDSIPFDELYFQGDVRRIEQLGNHTITGGVEYSHSMVDTGLFDREEGESAKESLDAIAAYIQNDFRVLEQLLLNASVRYDYNEIAEGHMTTRGSAIYLPNDKHSLRFTYGTSYRNPNFIEYFYDDYTPGVTPLESTLTGQTIAPSVSVMGNEDNEPELAESFELGYRGNFSERLELLSNLFFMRVEDFTALDIVGFGPWYTHPMTGDIIRNPATGQPIPSHVYIEHTNTGKAEAVGAEVGVRYQINDWLGSFANYTWVNSYETEADISERLLCTATNRANGGLEFSFENGFDANILVHYADITKWPTDWNAAWVTADAGGTADAYTLVNLGLGYTMPVGDNSLRLSVFAFNVFDEEHSQYPVESAPLTRKVTATASLTF